MCSYLLLKPSSSNLEIALIRPNSRRIVLIVRRPAAFVVALLTLVLTVNGDEGSLASRDDVIKVIHLLHSDAVGLASTVSRVFRANEFTLVPEEQSNSIILRGLPADLQVIEALLTRLDEPPFRPAGVRSRNLNRATGSESTSPANGTGRSQPAEKHVLVVKLRWTDAKRGGQTIGAIASSDRC